MAATSTFGELSTAFWRRINPVLGHKNYVCLLILALRYMVVMWRSLHSLDLFDYAITSMFLVEELASLMMKRL
jgi:hypothetical protein